MTMEVFARRMPMGIPTREASSKAWDQQKDRTPERQARSDNRLDTMEIWEPLIAELREAKAEA